VEPVFREWLERTHPHQQAKVEARIRTTRGGKMYESQFGVRMKGRGEIAEQIGNTFQLFAAKHGLLRKPEPLDCSQFRPPLPPNGQRWLF
jgi:DNA repair photolyase